MPENVHLKRALVLLYAAISIIAVWLFFKHALVWLLPFIIAYLFSRLMEPVVRFLSERHRLPRALASGLLTLIIFALTAALLTAIISRIIYEFAALARELPELLKELSASISSLKSKIDFFIITAPEQTQEYLYGALDSFIVKSTDFAAGLSGKLIGFLTSIAASSPKLIVFVFTCAVGTFFISSGYKEITSFIMRQLPKKYRGTALKIKSDFFGVMGKWVKAELILGGLTFIELLAAFLIMRIEFAIVLAFVVAVIDILPLLGVGSVLIPWSLVAALGGDYKRCVTLLVTYVIIAIVRNVLEPKIVGAQLGLHPAATLFALYVGFCSAGIVGMMLFPVGLIMLKQLNERGIITLWKD